MEKEFSKIVFITHQFWPQILSTKSPMMGIPPIADLVAHDYIPSKMKSKNNAAWSPVDSRNFIEGELLPILERAKNNAIFVFVKTPTVPEYVLEGFRVGHLRQAAKTYGFGDYDKLD